MYKRVMAEEEYCLKDSIHYCSISLTLLQELLFPE